MYAHSRRLRAGRSVASALPPQKNRAQNRRRFLEAWLRVFDPLEPRTLLSRISLASFADSSSLSGSTPPAIAVLGHGLPIANLDTAPSLFDDTDFAGGRDRVQFVVNVGAATGPFQVDAELRFQPIGYRWAQNLTQYDASEVKRFVRYYDSLAPASSEVLSRSTAQVSSSSR